MVQPTDPPPSVQDGQASGAPLLLPACRRILADAKMRPVLVVVSPVLCK